MRIGRERCRRRVLAGTWLAVLGAVAACTNLAPASAPAPSPAPSPLPAGAATPVAARAPLRLLLVNDVYSSDTLRDGRGGLARVAGWRDALEDSTQQRALFLFAGDLFSPSLLSKWYHGVHMVQALNAARVDYGTLGNHEFDIDRDEFVRRLEESQFPWLSANCRFGDGTAFPNVRGWDTLTVAGTRLGIFGTTVETTYRSWVRCTDATVAARAAVDTLSSLGVELIVGLTHQFIWHDRATLENDPRITLLLGGHEHNGQRVERDGRLLVKAASNARTAVFVEARRQASGWSLYDSVLRPARGWYEQPATAELTAAWRDTLVRLIGADRTLGVAPEPIDAVDSTSRGGESRFGNLVADAYRAGTRADVALLNSGALRLDDMIGAGEVTAHTIESVFLFADETRVVTFPLTGARLRELLEHGVSAGRLGSGAYPQVSGVQFTYDVERVSGARILGEVKRTDGTVIRDGDMVRVAMPSYPACRGGDGYRIPEAQPACAAYDGDTMTAPRSADLVLRHLEGMNGRIVAPPVNRVRRLGRSAPPPPDPRS